MTKMYVLKRDGREEDVSFDKITCRIQKLCYGLNMKYVDPSAITYRVIRGLYTGVSTVQLDNLAAEICATMTTQHPDYAVLAARIAISNLHKETKKAFSERSYLMKINGKIVERPQHMLMRVAIAIHEEDIEKAIETYNYLSERYFTHASPTLFAACSNKQQLCSCFLLTINEDSIEGIYETLKKCALISKWAGGIGLSIHCIRAKGTPISGNHGESRGLVPMLKIFNDMSRYVDQGGNKRPGAFAIYIEPWHADIFEFLDLKKNTGDSEIRARELFYALWIPDLFMNRVLDDDVWSLMCPHESPGLENVWGKEFDDLYIRYEEQKSYKRQVKARDLWTAILKSQVETGTPYMLYKDHCNRKSNQQNLGTIKSSNLCTEIIQYTDSNEIAVCNLASIAVNMFINKNTRVYDFEKLKKITKVVVRNLDKVIDVNSYPLPESRNSNLKHRPIGIGIQGLADAFLLMRFPFESEEAKNLNIQIFETLYYGALEASCELAQEKGYYETYEGSPVSKGILQYDMWGVTPTNLWNWKVLKEKIAKHGVRNSLLLAPMPTASTAQILGNNESIEPYTSNIYSRRVLSGEYQIVNPHLLKDLIKENLWNEDIKNEIIANNGSIQDIDSIPNELKLLYKTVWEISQKTILRMAADRGAFIDQSQSLNVYIAKPTVEKLTSMHFYGWQNGLKTGMYYLRTKPAANALQFTVDKSKLNKAKEANNLPNSSVENECLDKSSIKPEQNHFNENDPTNNMNEFMCSLENGDACMACGS
ncbi:hypothetical protein M0802_000238 [Mischocyttarus mexicanus]|nr:hypothetical protein M0802_000238 [Mischocyttarus mexicanus]